MPKHGSINLYVHGSQKASLGRTAQDGHLDSHTAPEVRNIIEIVNHYKVPHTAVNNYNVPVDCS